MAMVPGGKGAPLVLDVWLLGGGKLFKRGRKMPFNVGDMAVYPAHGVGVVEAIEQKQIGELTQTFYVMRIVDNGMVIMIPTQNCDNVGLRAIIPSHEVEEVLNILRQRNVETEPQTWNRRYREYMEKIKTGSVYEVAAVLRDLYLLREEKALSFGERKMMDTAKTLLVKELSLANNTKEKMMEKNIEEIFDMV